ncbi:MAG: FAD-dependent monooxygenase [Candidatus Odinarchaeota archaeon]
MSEKVDVLISGLGPAGALVAQQLVRSMKEKGHNYSVLAIEKKKEIGKPVYCGEFMPSVDEMSRLMPEVLDPEVFRIDERYYYTRTGKIIFVDPEGRERETRFEGYTFDRGSWIRDLVKEAEKGGVEIWSGASSVSYDSEKNIINIRHNGATKSVTAKIIVCAEGYHSVINREVNLLTERQKTDFVLTTGFQTVEGLQKNPEEVYMYFGKSYSPGAYAWIIPKGNNVANIGTGVRLTHRTDETMKQIMNNLFSHPHAKKFLEGAKTTNKMGKPVPVGLPPERLRVGNVVGIGDTVNQVISAVGAGIPTAQVASDLLSKAIVRDLNGTGSLREYEIAAEKYLNPAIRRSWKLRRIFDRISDTDSRFKKYFRLLSGNDMQNVVQARLNLKLKLLSPFIPIGNLIFR